MVFENKILTLARIKLRTLYLYLTPFKNEKMFNRPYYIRKYASRYLKYYFNRSYQYKLENA